MFLRQNEDDLYEKLTAGGMRKNLEREILKNVRVSEWLSGDLYLLLGGGKMGDEKYCASGGMGDE